MAYQDKDSTQAAGREEKELPEKQNFFGESCFCLPNSVKMGMPIPPPGTPNSVMREMFSDPQIPAAEEEAERLSAGVTSGTPHTVRREMGRRLGSDFSSVRFHTSSESARINRYMGSLAYTRGGDIFFGSGGFSPQVAAHELVHTVQQGAVSGRVSQSVPSGTVQRGLIDRIRGFFHRNRDQAGAAAQVADAADRAPAPAADRADPAASAAGDADRAPAPAAVRPAVSAADAQLQPAQRTRKQGYQGRIQQLQTQLDDMDRDILELENLTQLEGQQPDKMKRMLRHDGNDRGTFYMNRFLQADLKGEIDRLQRDLYQIEDEQQQRPRGPLSPDQIREMRNRQAAQNREKAQKEARIRELQEMQRRLQNPQQLQTMHGNIYTLRRRLDRITQQIGEMHDPGQIDAQLDQIKTEVTALWRRKPDPNEMRKIREQYQHHQDRLAVRIADLPEPRTVFNLDDNDQAVPRWRMSSERVNIDGLVKYYIAWCDMHGRDRGFQGDIAAPVRGGLAAAHAAIAAHAGGPGADAPAGHAAVPAADQAGPAPLPNGYHAEDPGVKGHKSRIAEAEVARNSGALVNAGGKFGVLMDHDIRYGPMEYTNSETGKKETYGRWDLAHSKGDYSSYTDYVAPIAGGVLGAYGATTGLMNAATSTYDAYRKYQNMAVGGSGWDVAQSSLDAAAGLGAGASGAWTAVESFSSVGGPAVDMGGAALGVPIISGLTGLANSISGGIESERARRAGKKINAASGELAAIEANKPAPPPAAAGRKSDRQNLEEALEQTKMVTDLHHTTGALKSAAGAAQVAASVSTLAGGAPVAAAFQGAAAILSIAKFAFERGFKHHMRKKVVGTYYNINWKQEMDDVREMISTYNDKFSLRDKDVREIILKAHGSDEATRTDAFKGINRKRAKYLIDTANNVRSEYQKVAEMVVEAMGIHRVGNDFVNGAIDLLAEKLAG